MLDTSPTAKLSIKFAGIEVAYIENNGTLTLVAPGNGETSIIFREGALDVFAIKYYGVPTSPNNELRIEELHSGYGTIFKIKQTGDTWIAGSSDVSSLLIGGTSVISSSCVLQNVNIDRATTDLPPCKVLEDRNVYSVTAGAALGTYWISATNTYVDTVVGYKQIRLLYQIKCV